MDKQIPFAEKIRAIRTARNLTMEAFGEIVGVSKGTVSLWESGKNLPPKTTMSLIDKLFGEGPQYREERKDVMCVGEAAAVYGAAPQFREVKVYALAGAGHPKELVAPDPIDAIIVPRDFLGPSIVPVKVRGESMVPTIYEDAIVGVDQSDKEIIISGKIYAVYLSYEGATIKRLYLDTESLTLKSDNPLFAPFSVPIARLKEENTFVVLGRVRWVIQKL